MTLSNEEAITRIQNVHGNKYLFDKFKYINKRTKIILICPKHGEFEILFDGICKGSGCRKCLSKTGIDTNNFIEKAKETHGDKYIYDYSNFIASESKIRIDCRIHGEFWQLPHCHIVEKQNCPYCSGNKSIPIKCFIEEAIKAHGNKYDYSNSKYNKFDNCVKVNIKCHKHGEFFQRVSSHLNDRDGCPSCSGTKKLTQEEYINDVKLNHSYNYDYSFVNYVNMHTKIKIICLNNNHGEFFVKAYKHLYRGDGCPKCSHTMSKKEVAWLDKIIKLPDDANHRQVRINIKDFNGNNKIYKVDGFDKDTNTVYEFNGDYWHGNPNMFKEDKINKSNNITFGELYRLTIEKEELIKSAGYNLISIWEEEFDKLNFE